MLLWFAGAAIVIVWSVFHDTAIDHRLLVAGSLLPDVVDVWTGGRWFAHTVLASVLLLAVVMGATVGRRLLRRRLLALPIGTFLHLVLDGIWTDEDVFWWPAFGTSFGDLDLPSLDRGALNITLELAGLAMLVWVVRRFRLTEPDRRRQLLTTGRFGRDLA